MVKKTNDMIERVKDAVVCQLMEQWKRGPRFYMLPGTKHRLLFSGTTIHLLPDCAGPKSVPVMPVDFNEIYAGDDAYNQYPLEKLLFGPHPLVLGCNVYDPEDFRQFLADVLLPAVTDPMTFLVDVVGLRSLEQRLRDAARVSSAVYCPGLYGVAVWAGSGELYWFDDSWTLRVSSCDPRFRFAAVLSAGYTWDTLIRYVAPGMTFSECFLLYLQPDEEKPADDKKEKLIVLRNLDFSFERVRGNHDGYSLNFVMATASVDRHLGSPEASYAILKKNIGKVKQYLLEKLAGDPEFQQYKIPVSCLSLLYWTFKKDYSLECSFEVVRPRRVVCKRKEC